MNLAQNRRFQVLQSKKKTPDGVVLFLVGTQGLEPWTQ